MDVQNDAVRCVGTIERSKLVFNTSKRLFSETFRLEQAVFPPPRENGAAAWRRFLTYRVMRVTRRVRHVV